VTPNTRAWLPALAALCALAVAACEQKMAWQPSYRPLGPSESFPEDHRSARPLVAGTVARGQLRDDDALYRGKDATGEPVKEFPFAMTKDVLERGRQRYNIFCAVCHGVTGLGDGRIVQRGFTPPPAFYPVRDKDGNLKKGADGNPARGNSRYYKLRGKQIPLYEVPVGHLYDVISNGFGAMPDYASQVPVRDRWAIAGYVRALQYSQSPEARAYLQKQAQKGGKQ
jgi:mono/diheme cytochrome c family protein